MTAPEPLFPNFQFHNYRPVADDLQREVQVGLSREQPALHPKWLYDARGSQLFEAITRQPEYYPTATETALLEDKLNRIAELAPGDAILAEPGAGNCEKARLVLEHWQPGGYMPVEISHDQLLTASRELARDFPALNVQAVCADYTRALDWPEAAPPPRLVFFPGSTIGNFEPEERAHFLGLLRDLAGPGGALVLGADLQKDTATLNAAYNDAAGYTAAFNENLITHLNRELDTQLDANAFQHEAFYNEKLQRVEMHLRCQRTQTTQVGTTPIKLPAGCSIHTENSYKFDRQQLQSELAAAGFEVSECWQDARALFSLTLARSA